MSGRVSSRYPALARAGLVRVDGRPLASTEAGALVRSGPARAANGAADSASSELAAWHPALRSANADLLPERNTIVARVRDLARNNGWGAGAVQRYIDQVIGATFRWQYRPDWRGLGFTDPRAARDWARTVERAFRRACRDPRNPFDAGGRMSFAALLGLLFRTRIVEGECFALAIHKPRAGVRQGLAVQVIDPDRLSQPMGRPEDETCRAGVEIDPHGAAIAYHVREAHPGDLYRRASGLRWQRVPAATAWGRRLALHFFEPERAEQLRGRSLLSPVVKALRMESLYRDIEMQRAITSAMFAAFVETPFSGEDLLGDGAEALTGYVDGQIDYHGAEGVHVGGVKVGHLYPGERIIMPQPNAPNSAFGLFEESVLRHVAAATGQSYEQLAGDWSKTNYSSGRMALLDVWKAMSARRDHFGHGVATPIFALWLEEALEIGTVPPPPGAPPFWDAFDSYVDGDWIGPGRGWVDPVKEAQASGERVDRFLSTLSAEAAEAGEDLEDLVEQRAYDRDLLAEFGFAPPAGVPPDGDGGISRDAVDLAERQQSGG